MSLSNPTNPPIVNEHVATRVSTGLVFAVDENQTRVNQIHGINPVGSTGAGIPKPVTSVTASIANASVGASVTLSVRFQRNPQDNNFAGVNIYAKGYQGNNTPVKVGGGQDSPCTVVLNNTGESVTLIVQSVGNGGVTPIASSPTYGIKLPKSTIGGAGKTTITSAVNFNQLNGQVGTKGTSPVNASGISTAVGSILSQSGTSTTINVASFTIQYGFGQLTYNSGSVNPGSYGKFTVYFSDPTYKGGATSYLATSAAFNSVASDGLQGIGVVTTAAGGGGTGGGGGGGGGSCFSPNTLIKLQGNPTTIGDLAIVTEVLTAAGTWKPVFAKLIKQYKGPMFDMGGGELVTPNHAFLIKGKWVPASDLGLPQVEYEGPVMNLIIQTTDECVSKIMSDTTEHSYTLENGYKVHNFLPS